MNLKRAAAGATLGLMVDAALYAILIRPRLIRWGLTREEAGEFLPGDEVVTEPRYVATHAVDIEAPAEEVWPWLVQMGQGRCGFYSYDWVENICGLDIHSADCIVPEFQELKPGDRIDLSPRGEGRDFYFEVAAIEPEEALVLATPGSPEENFEKGLPYGTWAFVIRETGPGRTRLIARMRADFSGGLRGLLANKYGLEPVHFVMERRMLLGIKERVEAASGGMTSAPGSDAGLEEAQPEAGREAA